MSGVGQMSNNEDWSDEDYKVVFRNSHLLAIQAKESESENDSIAPMCVLGFKNIVVPSLMLGVGPGQLNEACKKAIAAITDKDSDIRKKIEEETGEDLGPILWIVIHAEAYTEEREGKCDNPNHDHHSSHGEGAKEVDPADYGQAGDLGKRFHQGDPKIREAVNTIGIYPGGQYTISHLFRWTPVDGYEWDNPPNEFDEPGDERWTYFALAAQEEE